MPQEMPNRLPLVVMPDNRDETTNKDARLINGYTEKSQITGHRVFKRPGLLANVNLSGNGYGTFNWQNDVYAIFGAVLYKNGVAVNSAGGGATATAVLGHAVASATVTAGGSGYSAATVAFTGGGGTGAAGTVNLSFEEGGTDVVASITLTAGGSGYTSAPAVVISGDGSGATATSALVSEGSVGSITVTAGGSGFTTAPTVRIASSGTLSSFTVTSGGTGYTSAPGVTITGDGTGATATANLTGNSVTSITLTAAGTGYTVASVLFDSTSGSGAAATVNLTRATATATVTAGAVSSIAVNTGGSGYTVAPTINITGGLDTSNGVYAFSSCLGTKKMFLMNGVKAYTYDDANGLVQVTDANYPAAAVKGAAYLDGVIYVMDANAKIYGSSINDPQTWPALDTIIAQIEPDGGVAIAKQLVYVMALKQWTTEVFFDSANPVGSALGAVQGARLSYGCASADSVQDIDSVLVWMSTNLSAGFQIILVDQLKASVISSKPIERLLEKATVSVNQVFSWQLKIDGHRFYLLTLKSLNLTLCFDLNEKMWSQWTDTNDNYFPIVSATYNGITRYLQHETNGKLYNTDSSYVTDDGSLITVDLYTPNFDGGTRHKKYLKHLEIIADQTTGSMLHARKSDDDYQSWSNFRDIDLGKKRPRLSDCGSFRRRAYHFRHRCNKELRIEAAELQMDVGTT